MRKIYVLVETENSWLFQDKEGNFLTELNMFGGVERVELLKKDYFDLQAAEKIESEFKVDVWLELADELELL